jgi:hypothetical protein
MDAAQHLLRTRVTLGSGQVRFGRVLRVLVRCTLQKLCKLKSIGFVNLGLDLDCFIRHGAFL